MAKTRRLMAESIKLVDAVIEVLLKLLLQVLLSIPHKRVRYAHVFRAEAVIPVEKTVHVGFHGAANAGMRQQHLLLRLCDEIRVVALQALNFIIKSAAIQYAVHLHDVFCRGLFQRFHLLFHRSASCA